MNILAKRLSTCAVGLMLLAILGCSSGHPMGDVTGSVTIDGTPVEKGSISFFPASGQGPSTGGEIVAGKYTVQAPVGNCKVEIRVPKVVGQKKLYDTPDSPVQNVLEEVLPAKFNNATELTLDVKEGANDKNWELATK